MTSTSWEHQREVRDALRTIVSDPQLGVPALSSAQTMSNLLKDLLPDAPRETSVLVAAAEAGLAQVLLDHVSQGMDIATASSLTASAFAARTPFTADACNWAVAELSVALGLAPGAPAGGSPVGPPPAGFPRPAWRGPPRIRAGQRARTRLRGPRATWPRPSSRAGAPAPAHRPLQPGPNRGTRRPRQAARARATATRAPAPPRQLPDRARPRLRVDGLPVEPRPPGRVTATRRPRRRAPDTGTARPPLPATPIHPRRSPGPSRARAGQANQAGRPRRG